MRDRFGRDIDYLRISIIDHCNLRCVYCMPLGGVGLVPSASLMTPPEIEVLARAAVYVGFRKIRLTGGEPTLRPDLVEIIQRIAAIDGLGDLALTTNGILLPRTAHSLARAGLKRVNVHLDTLDPERLTRVMRFGTLNEIWAGLLAAESANLRPLKINAVVTRGFNDGDVVDMARLTLEREWHVRFIELMPLGVGEPAATARLAFVPSAETRARIEEALGPLLPVAAVSRSDESRNFRLTGSQGIIGFISPVSEPYCGGCNRLRVTAEGKLHLCLLNDAEIDIRPAARSGDLEKAAAILQRAIGAKPTGHRLSENRTSERREMFQIGG